MVYGRYYIKTWTVGVIIHPVDFILLYYIHSMNPTFFFPQKTVVGAIGYAGLHAVKHVVLVL